MPYYLTKTNGDSLVTVEDGSINTTATDLSLLGKNYPTYGASLNQNFIKLLENFASVDQPSYPMLGQVWYDSSNKKLKFYREGSVDDTWREIAAITESSTEPTETRQGDLWYDTDAQQVKIYTGTDWLTIGPQTTNNGLLRIGGTNSFIVQIGGSNVLVADAAGRVTKPLNPAVQAHGRYGSTNFTTAGLAQFTLWKPLTIDVNVGTYFNNGTFTCPVTGIYQVRANLTTLGPGASIMQWRKNDISTNIVATNSHAAGYQCLSAGGIISATAGDLITLVAATEASTYISYQNNSYSISLIS